MDDPLAGEVDTGLLGGILGDTFGSGLASISEAQLNHFAHIHDCRHQGGKLRPRHAPDQTPHRERLENHMGRIQAPALHTVDTGPRPRTHKMAPRVARVERPPSGGHCWGPSASSKSGGQRGLPYIWVGVLGAAAWRGRFGWPCRSSWQTLWRRGGDRFGRWCRDGDLSPPSEGMRCHLYFTASSSSDSECVRSSSALLVSAALRAGSSHHGTHPA